MTNFDIVVIGTGIVGLATACALAQLPYRIAIIDNKKIVTDLPKLPQIRASAINTSSERFFSDIGVWQDLLSSKRVLSFHEIKVREHSGFASLDAHCKDYHYDNLGHIIENELIIKTLYEKALCYSNITFFSERVNQFSIQSDKAVIQLSDNTRKTTKLIIAADGANSWVRQEAKIKLWQYPYRHHAIITTVKTKKPHRGCARQLFYPDGIIAFLPFWDPHLSCLVWSAKPDKAAELQQANPASFADHLGEMTSDWLGPYELVNQRETFRLIARYAPEFVKHRLILIGDAAHTVHPLAGQGANLGLRDSAQLANLVKRLNTQRADIGLKQHWNGYQFARHKDALTMLAGMQSIESLFDGQFVLKTWFRGLGMNLINRLPMVKKRLINYALGL